MRCPSCKELLDLSGVKFCPGCGASVDFFLPDPLVGQMVAQRYRVTHLLAEGGMGRVYAAEQSMGASTRKVAIKVLLAEYSGRDQDVQRLARECGTVAELEHPNTIKFYDYGETRDGDLFIAMEFLSGEALSQIIKQGPLAAERVDLIVGQICGSLQEAHDRGIVHRDLKPDNILVTSPGGAPDFVKVLDFGIAKRVGGKDPKLTPLGVVLGSPPYMSPEQFTMQDVDHRSDIYSLGVVAYQLLTGHLPFNATDPIEWAALHMGAQPTPIDAHGIPIPPQMHAAIHRALSKEPKDRQGSMRELFSELTIGVGSLEPGRLSSMLPLVSSQIPFPSPPRPPRIDARPSEMSLASPGVRRSSLPTSSMAVSVRAPPSEPPQRFEVNDPTHDDASSPELGSGASSDAAARASDPLLSTVAAAPIEADAPETIRDAPSAPEIHLFQESASHVSLPSSETAALRAGKGTLVMAASEPPPRRALTMPDLIPPTIRDPAALAATLRRASGRSLLYVALGLIGIGAIASAVAWFFYLRGPATKPKAKPKSTTSAEAIPAPTDEPAAAPPGTATSPAVVPTPTGSAMTPTTPPEKLSPCETAIYSAVSGKCDVARRAYQRCSADSTYHASATRTLDGLCPLPR